MKKTLSIGLLLLAVLVFSTPLWPASMVTSSNYVDVAGTRETLAKSAVTAIWVQIQALCSNQSGIYVGSVSVSKTLGEALLPCGFYTLGGLDNENRIHLLDIYIDADTSNDGVMFNYIVR
jgi:hypothetical protein